MNHVHVHVSGHNAPAHTQSIHGLPYCAWPYCACNMPQTSGTCALSGWMGPLGRKEGAGKSCVSKELRHRWARQGW